MDVHHHIVLDAAVVKGFSHREIGIVKLHVLAHHGDRYMVLGGLGPLHSGAPLGKVGFSVLQPQPFTGHMAQPLPLQHEGHLVENGGGQVGDHILRRDVAKQGDLAAYILRNVIVRAAQDHVGLDAQAEKFLGGMLGGLALELPRAGDRDHQGHVEEHAVLPPHLSCRLADGLQKGLGLDVAHGAADLGDDHIGPGLPSRGVDPALDLVGDMGDDLHRPPQIIPVPLPVQDGPVDLA